ncbi:hypothetical protein DIS24_g5120 [Lasiodiplodia hormozganensis]|uniref:Uncharacterized protein n=1 Tax=Lasiodiplodia hormozganensis TaxID=869390 RepID=A0AA40CZE0_9PEZI|nr:hypothetical protein DIS24_g5120 [Lasiodiplodia hormozganensis]
MGAAPTRDANSNVKPLDRVLPVLQLHLAPVFASSFSRSDSVKSMATYGKRVRGPFSFSVFRDDHGAPGDAGEGQSHSKLQKRPRRDDPLRERPEKTTLARAKPSTTPSLPQPAFVSSTTSDDPVDLSRPLANPDLPRLPEARLSSREPPASQHLARRSLQPLSSHFGHPGAPDLTSGSASRSASRHARSTSASTDGAIVHRLSSTLEPVGTPLSYRAPAALSQLWSTPSSPALSPVTCQRASRSGSDELPVNHCRFSRPFAAHNSSSSYSLSDRSDTLTTNTSNQRTASDFTDATLTDTTTDLPSLALRQKFGLRNRRAVRQAQKMDRPNASMVGTVGMGPEHGNPNQFETRNASSASLFNKVSGVLGEKSANLKRSLPFMTSMTPPKPVEKMSIGAPYDVRQGAEAMSTPPRRPKAGEDVRSWGAPERVNKKPVLPGGIEQQPKSKAMKTHGNSGTRDGHSTSPHHDTMKTSSAEHKKDPSVGKQSLGRSSPSMTALPTRPPTSIGLRGWVSSTHRLSKLALNEQSPGETSDNDSSVENASNSQHQQDQSRPAKASILERMKNTLNLTRRHKRRNTTVQTAVDLHNPEPATSLRTSRSAAMLSSPLAFRSERPGKFSPTMESIPSAGTKMPELPPINSGPAITFSSMSLLHAPRADDRDISAPASKSPVEAYGGRTKAELPAFATESSMPDITDVSGHNGFHRMSPLRSHTNVMEFAEAPSAVAATRMTAIPEDKAEAATSEGSALGRASPKSAVSGGSAAEGTGGEVSMSRMSNVSNSASTATSPLASSTSRPASQ